MMLPIYCISNLLNLHVVLSYLFLNHSLYLLKYQFHTLLKSLFMFFFSSLDVFFKVGLISFSCKSNTFLSLLMFFIDFFFCACIIISYFFVYSFLGELHSFSCTNRFSPYNLFLLLICYFL